MGEATSISWCDHTFNPWIGCTKVGPACDGCYAEALMSTEGRMKRVTWGKPGQRATHVRTSEAYWRQPLAWDRKAARDGNRAFVFCASLADVFDNDVPADWRGDLFDLIPATPNLTWLLLTKRPQNIVKLFADARFPYVEEHVRPRMDHKLWWPKNAAIGCTVVTQAEADRDIPHLLAAKAALNPAFAFVSMDPLLEAVDLTVCRPESSRSGWMNPLTGARHYQPVHADHGLAPRLDWVITGGETDQGQHKARPSHPDWFRSLRDQCDAAGVPFHFKQWGEWLPEQQFDREGFQWAPGEDARVHWWGSEPEIGAPLEDGACSIRVGKKAAGRALDGLTHDVRPEARHV